MSVLIRPDEVARFLWLFKAVCLEGNERAAGFIYPGAFVPFGER